MGGFRKKSTELSVFSEELGFDGPRINLGPCGPFALDFITVWNDLSKEAAHIVFVMEIQSGDCWHIIVRLPDGKLFDGGIGIHTDSNYDDQRFYLEDMTVTNMSLLEKRAYGLNRSYLRHCPKFDRVLMRKLIIQFLERYFEQSSK